MVTACNLYQPSEVGHSIETDVVVGMEVKSRPKAAGANAIETVVSNRYFATNLSSNTVIVVQNGRVHGSRLNLGSFEWTVC